MEVQPYLFFDGRCDEAIEFYTKALGAKVDMLMRYKDSPEACDAKQLPRGSENKVMHASLHIGDTVLMASDGHCSGRPAFQGFALSISTRNAAEAGRLFNALGDGGKVVMPLEKTFWSESFGMVADRFGVSWMVGVAH